MNWLKVCFVTFALLVGAAQMNHASVNEVEIILEKWLTANFPDTQARWETWLLAGGEMDKHATYVVVGVRGVKKPKKIMTFKLAPQAESRKPIVEVRARVVKFVQVPVTTRIIRQGAILQKNDWIWQERNAEILSRDVIKIAADLCGKRCKKTLSRAEAITAHALEQVPLVCRGQKMVLRVLGFGLILSTDVISLEEGQKEDLIQCKQVSSGQIVKARIVRPDEAQIVLTQRRR